MVSNSARFTWNDRYVSSLMTRMPRLAHSAMIRVPSRASTTAPVGFGVVGLEHLHAFELVDGLCAAGAVPNAPRSTSSSVHGAALEGLEDRD